MKPVHERLKLEEMTRDLKIIHLSDFHLCSEETALVYGINPYNGLSKVLKLIRENETDIDLIIVTGDISEDRQGPSYVIADSLLKMLENNCYWLPGNHDDFSAIPTQFKGKYLQDIWQLGKWNFISLDTTVKGEDHGFLSSAELQRLRSFLDRQSEAQVIICMHHPPVDVGSEFIDSIGLRNQNEFWEVLRRHKNVKAILCGHVHQQIQMMRHGVMVSSAPSTFVQWLAKSRDFKFDTEIGDGYNRMLLKADGSVAITTFRNTSKSD